MSRDLGPAKGIFNAIVLSAMFWSVLVLIIRFIRRG